MLNEKANMGFDDANGGFINPVRGGYLGFFSNSNICESGQGSKTGWRAGVGEFGSRHFFLDLLW